MDIASHKSATALIQSLGFKAMAGGHASTAAQLAKSALGAQSGVVRLLEKQVIGTSDLQNDPELRAASRGFLELTKARSLIARIPGWRRTAFETRTLRQTIAPVATWTGQNQNVAVSTSDFRAESLPSRKIATIAVTTNEVARGAGEGFTSALSADLVRAVTDLEARSLLDPANAGIPDVAPPSLTYGVTPITSSGTDADAVRADFMALFAGFAGDLETAVLVMHPDTALALSLMQNPLGEAAISVRGGSLFGIPAFASSALPFDSSGGIVALLDPTRILLADDGGSVDMSTETTLTIGEDSSGDPIVISLFQENLTAFMAERFLNWLPAPGAVAYLSEVNWGSAI